jgi:hypothetical protein
VDRGRLRRVARLATATQPAPVSIGPSGKRAEILLDRQIALLTGEVTAGS